MDNAFTQDRFSPLESVDITWQSSDLSGFATSSQRLLSMEHSFPSTQLPFNPAMPSPPLSSSPFLHLSCQLFPKSKEVIEIALSSDPTAAGASVQIARQVPAHKKSSTLRERYTYPINIALFHQASPAIVELLANAAPDVLVLPDGKDGHTSLGILLQLRCQGGGDGDVSSCLDLVDAFLRVNPTCAHNFVDRRQNFPLHVACSKGAPLDIVQRIHAAYPAAIWGRNLAGETPLMIAQRYGVCREDVLDYLQSKTWI